MPTITLPDGSQRSFDKAVTVAEVAASIGAGLAKATVAGKVDGKLYAVYTPDMVTEMRRLISRADVIKPNYTEALFLLDRPYSTDILTEAEIKDLCRDLSKMGPRHVILSSIPHQTEAYVAVYDGETDELQKASTPLIPVKAHGSGDIFTAVLTGMWLRGDRKSVV